MARLTTWNGKKYVLPQGRTCDGESYWRIIADRLAAYENTGYEPQEIPTKPTEEPKGWDVTVTFDGGEYNELCYGTERDLVERLHELRDMCMADGYDDAIIRATEWEGDY